MLPLAISADRSGSMGMLEEEEESSSLVCPEGTNRVSTAESDAASFISLRLFLEECS